MINSTLPTTELRPGKPLAIGENGLVPQPDRPSKFPIRVPVVVQCAGRVIRCEVIGSTGNVLLLQGADANLSLPPIGEPVRLKVDWDRQMVSGRLAAHGVASRFLVTIGERAIRRSRRFPVDLPGTATSAHLYGPVEVRVTDLSTGGARVQGFDLPVGTELELCFTPPGRAEPINVLGFVVRSIGTPENASVGVAFRLVQPSVDVLARSG
jgi:hypothetical protein